MDKVCELPKEAGLYQIIGRSGNRYWLRCEINCYCNERSIQYAVYDPSSWDELTSSLGSDGKQVQAKFQPVSWQVANVTVTNS